MREEMENKFDAILKEIKTNKTTTTITNPRSEYKTFNLRDPKVLGLMEFTHLT